MTDAKRILQIFRDGRKDISYLNTPLLDGEQGNLQTLEAMARIVREDRLQPDLRVFVLREIVGDVPGHDANAEVRRIFEYARDQIVYRRDPFGVERVADVWSTLYALNPRQPEGDCGIKSLFVASCCAIVGYKPFFVLIKQDPAAVAFSHVYNAVLVNGRLQYLDATPEGQPMGYEAKSTQKFLFPIF
jgi:hypothetical protein